MRPYFLKIISLFVGDMVALYGSLLLVLGLRYQNDFWNQFIAAHLLPFSLIFIIYILILYIVGLYDIRRLRNGLRFFRSLAASYFAFGIVSLAFFYFVPFFGITPKTNLALFLLAYMVIESVWRRFFNRISSRMDPSLRLIAIGSSSATEELVDFLKENPQCGYRVVRRVKEGDPLLRASIEEWRLAIKETRASTIVFPRHFRRDPVLSKLFLELLGSQIDLRDLPDVYESVLKRIPLVEVDEEWFLEQLSYYSLVYDDAKRASEFIIALVLSVVFFIPGILIAVLVKLTSKGPAIYSQNRTGKQGKQFVLYKFRTMRADAEKDGPRWASKNDSRTTGLGRFLRISHLDEIPQLWNILKGDLSLVGPRPERPELIIKLKTEIPYYEVRTFVKPGLTGWAQINQSADSTIEDVKKKLELDLYYIKNRAIILDLVILARTIKTFFASPEK